MTGRGWASRLALLAAACGFAVLGAEMALRMLGMGAPGLYTVNEREFRRIPGIFGPGQVVVEQPGTRFEHVSTIDSLGYRGHDFPRARAAGEMRVLYSGDSFTWGHNVGDDDTTPAQLEARLRTLCGPATVVINAGLSGSSILEEEALIERGLTMDPTAVVLMYHENDMDELVNNRIWEQLAINRARKSRPPLSLVYPLLRQSRMWNLLQEIVRNRRIKAGLNAVEVHGDTPASTEAAHPEYRTRLEHVARMVAAKGIPLLYVTYPHPESVTAGHGKEDYPFVLQTAAELGIPTVDLLPVLAASGKPVEELFLVPLDYHPSPAGHRVAADTLATLLASDPKYGCAAKPTG